MILFKALFLTIVIEGLVMYVLTHSKEWVIDNVLCNLATNPALNLCLTVLLLLGGSIGAYYIAMAAGEVLVLVTEMVIYRKLTAASWKTCFFRSLITNGASLSLGFFLMQ